MDKQNLKIKIGDLEFKNPLFCGSAEHFIEEAGIKKAIALIIPEKDSISITSTKEAFTSIINKKT